MTRFRQSLLGLCLAGVMASPALALDKSPTIDPFHKTVSLFEVSELDRALIPPLQIETGATIGVARLDGGRLIPTPFSEERDWTFLDRRVDVDIRQLGSGNYIKYIPEIPFDGQDTDNKIDEVRLTAANEGMDYVIIYGIGPDARWASFGNKALVETGLTVSPDCESWKAAKAKALLVDSYTGQVLGAVTSDNIDFHIGELADRVGELINALSGPSGV